MRVSFKFSIALAVVAALASSVSAMPTDDAEDYVTPYCPTFCRKSRECDRCPGYPHCIIIFCSS